MSRLFSLLISASLFGLTSCDYDDSRLEIINQGKSTICLETASDSLLNRSTHLAEPERFLKTELAPGDSVRLHNMEADGWPGRIGYNTNHKLNLFVYDRDSVLKHDYNFNALNRRELARISLSLEELEARHWCVVVK